MIRLSLVIATYNRAEQLMVTLASVGEQSAKPSLWECIIVDNNGLQIDGNVADVMSPYPIVDKLLAFGFNVHAVDGHDFDALEKAFENAKKTKGQPTAIVMSTVKGKGVSFMENDAGWHGKAPNDAEYEQAMSELKAQLAEVEGK